jgi:hypothetical protein
MTRSPREAALDARICLFVRTLEADRGEVPQPKVVRQLELYKRTQAKLQQDYRDEAALAWESSVHK